MGFKKGQIANPKGRPVGVMDKRLKLRALLEPYSESLVAKAVGMALEGDVQALKLCIDRLIPVVKSEFINIKLPDDLSSPESILPAGVEMLRAMEKNDISPQQCVSMLSALKEHRENIVVDNFDKRLTVLEKSEVK